MIVKSQILETWDNKNLKRLSLETAQCVASKKYILDILVDIGFPKWCAPNLYFNFVNAEWSDQAEFMKIGEDRDDRSILFNSLNKSYHIEVVPDQKIYFAGDTEKLLSILLLFADEVELFLERFPQKSLSVDYLGKEHLDRFETRGSVIDCEAFQEDSFWKKEIQRHLNRVDSY